MSRSKKEYCRYCGKKCRNFKLDKKNPHISTCKMNQRIISQTTPKGDAIVKAPSWCPKT